jgi:hypothetical protein
MGSQVQMKWSLVLLSVVGLLGGACGVGGGQLAGSGGAGGVPIRTGSGGVAVAPTGAAGMTGMRCGGVDAIGAPSLWPNISIVVDISKSMNDGFSGPCAGGPCGTGSKWSAVVSAIESVTSTPRAVNWGLAFLGSSDGCGFGDIGVTVGPVHGTAIPSQLDSRTTNGMVAVPGDRPTRAAIDEEAAYLPSESGGAPNVVLLVTDGVPNCGAPSADPLAGDAAGAVQSVTDALSAGVFTFVAGVGRVDDAAGAALSDLARAGGLARAASPPYAAVGSAADLAAVMTDLVRETSGCAFGIPDPPGNDGTYSRGDISLLFDDGTRIPNDPQDGWSYVSSWMWAVQLHGAACDAARSGKSVSVVFLCNLI